MCGIVGVGNHPKSKDLTYEALLSLKHRGQSASGIAVYDLKTNTIEVKKQSTAVDAGSLAQDLQNLPNGFCIGNTRFPTVGPATQRNAQPMYADTLKGRICICTNGEIDKEAFTDFLSKNGVSLRTQSDTELMLVYLHWAITQQPKKSIPEIIAFCMSAYKGSYCSLFMMEKHPVMYAFRDPYGIRPMEIGKIAGAYVIVSETCALDAINATYIRSVKPGEIVMINDKNELSNVQALTPQKTSFCCIELAYFMRPDSLFKGENIHSIRKRMGAQCAREHPVREANIICGVPKSGEPSAIGFAMESGKPFEQTLIENPIGNKERTYIGATKTTRKESADRKYKSIRDNIRDKIIVVSDDTIIRGLTAPLITEKLKACGANKIHWRIACPPHLYGCPYGMGYRQADAIAFGKTIDEIKQEIGCDSLAYLSLEGFYKAIGYGRENFCDGCLTGQYPV